jgi:hypothetical protein
MGSYQQACIYSPLSPSYNEKRGLAAALCCRPFFSRLHLAMPSNSYIISPDSPAINHLHATFIALNSFFRIFFRTQLSLDNRFINRQNIVMDYFLFALILLALIGIFIFVTRLDNKAKNRHKADAYEMLEISDPDPKKLKDCVRGLRLYSGRIRKDHEAMDLSRQLLTKHGHILDAYK